MHAYNTDITWYKLDSLRDSLPSTQQSKWEGYAAATTHPSMKAAPLKVIPPSPLHPCNLWGPFPLPLSILGAPFGGVLPRLLSSLFSTFFHHLVSPLDGVGHTSPHFQCLFNNTSPKSSVLRSPLSSLQM